MHVIDEIMKLETSIWVDKKIIELPSRAKFRAANSIRALSWANKIYAAEMPIPACYCALHATEEAVAAFISCAKVCDYEQAKSINIRDHRAKATVSFLVEKIITIIKQYNTAIAYDDKADEIVVRFTKNEETLYSIASTKLFHFRDGGNKISNDFYKIILEEFGDVSKLKAQVKKGYEARNEIFYADRKGLPTGFNDPERALRRECHITLGLIWAAIDMSKEKENNIPLISQALQTAIFIITAFDSE